MLMTKKPTPEMQTQKKESFDFLCARCGGRMEHLEAARICFDCDAIQVYPPRGNTEQKQGQPLCKGFPHCTK
tara:strand:- start:42 stop:257 length:216 start_codon:yes stop_codon:yes gene_type:complete